MCVAQAGGGAAPAAGGAPAATGAAGQTDYSAAWAEYYRQQAAYYGQNPQNPGQPAATQQGQQVHTHTGNVWICNSLAYLTVQCCCLL